jgi:hypothetical protein
VGAGGGVEAIQCKFYGWEPDWAVLKESRPKEYKCSVGEIPLSTITENED